MKELGEGIIPRRSALDAKETPHHLVIREIEEGFVFIDDRDPAFLEDGLF
jgi:hypothetical protein